MAIQSEISNILIDTSFVNKYKDVDFSSRTELVGSVNQVYSDIIDHSSLPHQDLSPAKLNEIKEIDKWLNDNEDNYQLYASQYDEAVLAFENEKHSQNPDAGKLAILDRKIKEAAFRWDHSGNRRLYDLKKGRYIYLTQEDPQAFWAKLKDKRDAQIKISPDRIEYLQTFLIPSISSWNSGGWSSFERQISESDSYDYSKSTSWSGGLSVGWGLWSFGGGTSGSTNYNHSESQVSTVNLKFEYLRVRIFRPWLTEDVFGYRFWTWNKQFGGQFISDGGNLNIETLVRPIGRMPVLPQYLIVVRNLELSATFSSEEKDFYNKQIQANASFGWGPFSIGGSYREETTTKRVQASFDGVTIKIQNPQIIARTGILLHKTPNPITSLAWNKDEACFPGEGCFSNEEQKIKAIRQSDYLNDLRIERQIETSKQIEQIKSSLLAEKLQAFK